MLNPAVWFGAVRAMACGHEIVVVGTFVPPVVSLYTIRLFAVVGVVDEVLMTAPSNIGLLFVLEYQID